MTLFFPFCITIFQELYSKEEWIQKQCLAGFGRFRLFGLVLQHINPY